ncbi:MAG: NDP-sugar synthase [Acidobacteriota bacterium]
MRAMILAAGLGTRLRPLTNDRPKALVTIHGRTLLEICLERLRHFGVREAIVNVHHFADMLVDYLHAHRNFGMRIEISREEELLDTGGGLKKAAWFFQEPGVPADEPFLLHNVDVVSTIDLARMVEFHRGENALATLAVQPRATSRYLLFSARGELCGRRAGLEGPPEFARAAEQPEALAFAGIHVLSPRLLEKLPEARAFAIIDAYLGLAAQGEKIAAFRADGYRWRDLGRPQSLAAAEQEMQSDAAREG